MSDCPWWLLQLVTLLAVVNVGASQVHIRDKNGIKSGVFLSPKFELEPGLVENKFYYAIDFPRGHIALKEFTAEVVDEVGNPVPLYETYLHHFVIARYYTLKDGETSNSSRPEIILVRNSGVCQELIQYFGLGSETRKTDNHIPDPYGIEVGDPAKTPDGYEEQWLLGIHAIDTRGVEDIVGCIECRCDLYNVTVDEDGKPLRPGYIGGVDCCYDQTRCRVKEGFPNVKRSLYARYRVKWVDWDDTIVPLKIYIFDVTDTGKKVEGNITTGTYSSVGSHCQLDYEVEPCEVSGISNKGCLDNKRTKILIPEGGYVIYGGAHQHSGGLNSTLYGEDGRIICSSTPIYGNSTEAGNEAGYVVEMSTCYPQPGSVQVFDGERLVVESNYNNTQRHSGVMAFFYIMVADQIPKEAPTSHPPVQEAMIFSNYLWALVLAAVTVTFVASISYNRRSRREGYEGYGLVM